jgi:hypothetical protein
MIIGHIKLDRRILNWEWYQDANVFRLFLHLLLSANYKDCNWQGQIIKRGQVVTGLDKLSQNTGLSVQQIRTCFEKLRVTGEITIKSTNKYRVVTICKYDIYQFSKNEDNKQINSQDNNHNNRQITDKQQTNNKQITASKEGKEGKEGKEVKEIESKGEKQEVTPPPDLSKSNLFRQPKIPTQENVWEIFLRNGGTKEMAEKFFETNSAVGWFLKGSPITNFANLVPSFIANWKKYESKSLPQRTLTTYEQEVLDKRNSFKPIIE